MARRPPFSGSATDAPRSRRARRTSFGAPPAAPSSTPRTAALALLGRRDYTASELRDKLADRGYSEADVTSTIDELRVRGLVDDRRLAAAAIRTSARTKGRGRVRIARDLEARGVDRALVHELLADLHPEDETEAIARILARKHWPAKPTLAERRRMFQHLLRRGFTADTIAKALRHRGDEEQ